MNFDDEHIYDWLDSIGYGRWMWSNEIQYVVDGTAAAAAVMADAQLLLYHLHVCPLHQYLSHLIAVSVVE